MFSALRTLFFCTFYPAAILLVLFSSLLYSAASFAAPATASTTVDLPKNNAQFNCMNFVMNSIEEGFTLDNSDKAKADYFGHYPVNVLPDGSYNVLVTYTQSGQKHKISCTVKETTPGYWSLIEKKEVK